MTQATNCEFVPEWHAARVMVFNGSRDTHINTGEDYDTISLADLFRMEPGDAVKEKALACVPSSYCSFDGRKHEVQRELGQFVTLTADIDKGDASFEKVVTFAQSVADAWLIYTSAHATDGDLRWRIILPLIDALPFPRWNLAQNALFNLMTAAGLVPDRSLERAAQPVFLPNVPALRASTGEALRGEFGEPRYYRRASSSLSCEGISIWSGVFAAEIAAIVRQERQDLKARAALQAEAEKRRKAFKRDGNESPIDDFNKGADLGTLLEVYGYERCPRNSVDWRSPHQSSESYATRIIEDKWVSLSASDAGSGLGATCSAGCYGDAYDLFVHFEHGGDHKAAFRELNQQRKDERAYRMFGKPEVTGGFR